jgi:uncharacterized membrane protein YsdA (DUF1294 family)
MKYVVLGYLAVVALMSIVSFVAYGLDKRRAQKDGRRVPEKTLQLMALFGGWPGALMGQRTFRHKTQKLSFRIVFWLCVALHLAIVGGAVYLWISSR